MINMEEEIKKGEGKIPWFLKLAFLGLILWSLYYLWNNVKIGQP